MGVQIYRNGLVHCSICTDLTDRAEIELEVNLVNSANPPPRAGEPERVPLRWVISENETFSGGEPNPCPCEQMQGRFHYLMEC